MKNILLIVLSNFILLNIQAQLFVEQSMPIGIDHAYSDRSLQGGGVAFFDFDNDGDEDLYLTGGQLKDDLYQNNGDGTFTKITADIGLNITQDYNTIGVSTGDIDNDGDREIFLTTWENLSQSIARNLLFNNNGDGTFTEIGTTSGITHPAFSQSGQFLDYNKDGFLDIYISNHLDVPAFLYDSTGVISGFDHKCYPNFLYRNNGDNTFSEVANDLDVGSDACSSTSISTDYDQDGDIDILSISDFGPFLTPIQLFQNTSNAFSDQAPMIGADAMVYGLGVGAADYDNDLDMDFYVSALGKNLLMEYDNGAFVDVADSSGVGNEYANGSEFSTGWGTAFLDVNNDSWEDIYVANGRIPSLPSLPTALNDPDKLFLNNGNRTFSDVTNIEGIDNTFYSRGMAYSDFDLDGDLDIFVVVLNESGGKSKLYVNNQSSGNNYTQIKLEGTMSNRDAFGSKVWLYAEGKTYYKELAGGSSYASQNSSILHFGLGALNQIDSLKIQWPSGEFETSSSVNINAINSYKEGFTTSSINPHIEGVNQVLFPNPTSGNIEITGDAIEEINIIDMYGRVLFFKKNPSSKLDISFLPKGTYLVRSLVKGFYITKRIVKN